MMSEIAKRSEQFFCFAKKFQECWYKNHHDLTWCDSGIYATLSLKAAAFERRNHGAYKHRHAQYLPKKHRTLNYVSKPMRPSKDVYKAWAKILPKRLTGQDSNPKADGRSIPATWTQDALIGS